MITEITRKTTDFLSIINISLVVDPCERIAFFAYGQARVIETVESAVPFTVASTVSVYSNPLVMDFVVLKLRLPVPTGYQVPRQVLPCHSFTVALIASVLFLPYTIAEQVAVSPLKLSEGTTLIARGEFACAETGIIRIKSSAKRNAVLLIGYHLLPCIYNAPRR